MDPAKRDQLRDELQSNLDGELLLDDLRCALYATDASLFEVPPLAVVRPRSEVDVQTVVRYAAEHQLPATARGAGTGTAGAALGPGIVLDFSRFLNAILAIGPDTIRAQAGASWEQVTARLARCDGRRLTVEPAGAAPSTLGGIVAANTAGPRVARLDYPRDQVVAIRAVLDNGDVVDFGPLSPTVAPTSPDRLQTIHKSTVALLERHAHAIVASRPRTPFNRCGYLLHDVLNADILDYPRLLAGTEGTLALFTEVTLRTQPVPGGRGVALFAFADLQAALKAVCRILPRRPSACELLDGRLLSLVRAHGGEAARSLPANAGAAILVEFESDTPDESRRQTVDLIDELVKENLALFAVPSYTPDEASRLWRLVDVALSSLERLRGRQPAVTCVEDVGVPPADVPTFLTQIQEVLQRYETTAAVLVHAAAGQIHLRPFLDPANAADAARLWAIAEDTYALALALGGTVSSRHGTGLARTPWVAKQYPRLIDVFRELKTIFDPRDVFNPGDIVGPDPRRPAWPLRRQLRIAEENAPSSDDSPKHLVPRAQHLMWKPDEFNAQIAACHGCGECRSQASSQRMCPIFRATRAEEATPRAKANLLRELLRPGADLRRMANADVRAVADLCVNCKMCAIECPSHVDVPRLMLEAKAAHVAEHGLDRSDWVMAHVGKFSATGSTFALLANQLLRGPISRWVMEKFFGITRRRRLPPFAFKSFLRLAERWGWTKTPAVNGQEAGVNGDHFLTPGTDQATPDRAALFVDIFANYHDPQIAEAAVRVLQHAGVSVVVPPEQLSCGMEALAQGDVETAREIARDNLRVFAELARDGYHIVCSEPTAAVMLGHDYLDLLDDPDARLVASRTTELTAYLWELHERGRLPTDFQPLPLAPGHHVPCHVKALGGLPAGPSLLGLIPELRVHTIDVSCSGMAGTYGLRTEGYETSLAAGKPMLDELRRPRVLFGSTECSACRLQMEEGSGKCTLHPVQYLALAYGLMPELAKRLQTPVGGLVLQ